jgi:hypothetical protein
MGEKMRPQVREFARMAIEYFGDDISGPVYEFGSLQVGPPDFADMRYLFPGKEFAGCDLLRGPGLI